MTASKESAHSHASEKGLFLASLGVVYGDIGTSPLYAMRECFSGHHGMPVSTGNVLGILSLIFWSMVIIVTVKYLFVMLRADNRGEGGMLALSALVMDAARGNVRVLKIFSLLGISGAALIYADAMITPAISVLSAVEGLQSVAPGLAQLVLPIAAGIVFGLFAVQSFGTAGIGSIFGPVMLLWFTTLGGIGLFNMVSMPEILAAINPWHAFAFFRDHMLESFRYLGSVFLVITGSEALYADMGHFGRKPIRVGWLTVVFPGLALNYFGQGALLLRDPQAAPTLFFSTVPQYLVFPLVLLSCAATVIASQAMISGAFSLTRQAVQLGYSPRLEVRQTSTHSIGQVYLPLVNWVLLVGVMVLLFTFRSSAALAGAYGVAVASAMMITTLFLFDVATRVWKWPLWLASLLALTFLIPDSAFLYANLLKLPQGGWLPLLIALFIGLFLSTWKTGRGILRDKMARESLPLEFLLEEIDRLKPHRVDGTAIFLTGNPSGVPITLLHNFKHNKVIHERVLLLNVRSETVPRVPDAERLDIRSLGQGFHVVTIKYGFSESPNIPAALQQLAIPGYEYNPMATTYFLGRETFVATDKKVPGFPRWRKQLFRMMSRNAQDATRFFEIPPNRVIELGVQVEI